MRLHGGLVDSRAWRDRLEDLSDEFTVVAWDAPGCAGSADPPDDFRLADYADSLAGLIDALGLHRPHVLGHSFGAGAPLAAPGTLQRLSPAPRTALRPRLTHGSPTVMGRVFWDSFVDVGAQPEPSICRALLIACAGLGVEVVPFSVGIQAPLGHEPVVGEQLQAGDGDVTESSTSTSTFAAI